ncbi:MAG: cytochrome-c peroxidase [Deltaproteobacteria bacterium]|nr:MAG: cytochrome-c peroxidase [Deltaproteobacteria bacterium]
MTRTALLSLALVACKPAAEETPELGSHDYEVTLPQHYTEGISGMPPGFQAATDEDNTPADNPVTNAGAQLGRVLFYDVDLSQNRTIACASCHQQAHGFSDPDVLSVGFEGGTTGRHSMGLTNARFYANGRFFWDQRAETLEAQVLMPMQDPVEMGMTLDEVVARVEEDERYAPLFEQAFGDATVSSDRISRSIAQFVRSMVSTTSRYDEGRAQVTDILDDFPNFTADENAGKRLFYAPPPMGGLGCAHCHGSDAQVGIGAISNGLDATVTDEGYGAVSGVAADMGTFKAPSLRNVAVRAPYMHDGRFASIDEVIEHYSSGVQYHATLFPFMTDGAGNAVPLNLTAPEKAQLKAFLVTLTDEAMLEDPKFSDPGW